MRVGRLFPRVMYTNTLRKLVALTLLCALIEMTSAKVLYHKLGERLIYRAAVPAEKCSWRVQWDEYAPNACVIDMKNKPWADPEIGEEGFSPKFNALDGRVDRRSHTGQYEVKNGYPLNPSGRTGISGRGRLGKWGPNHAGDPVVTRWKRTTSGVIDMKDGKRVLEFVAIERRGSGDWAIPGGMVDPGEHVSITLRREFLEEALSGLEMSDTERQAKEEELKNFFETNGKEIYRGLVSDDPRNTDSAWMETVVYNFHDESGQSVGQLNLKAGDDAADVSWKEISRDLKLYANHAQFIEAVAKHHNSYW